MYDAVDIFVLNRKIERLERENEKLKRATENMADIQPVKRGKWDFRGYQLFKCTNCKEIFTQNQLEAMQNHIDQEEFTFPNFCPNCGAKMVNENDP